MLNIVDINTNESSLSEVTRLKEEFRSLMSNVKRGNVVIISNFPAIGNLVGPISYVIIISVLFEEDSYCSIKVKGNYKYINNAVILVNSSTDNTVVSTDDLALRTSSGDFDYNEMLKEVCYDFKDYCREDEDIHPFAILKISSSQTDPFYNPQLIVNHPLTAKYLIWAIANQFVSAGMTSKGIYSFGRESKYTVTSELMLEWAKKLVLDTDKKTSYGILTKKKLDRISKGGVKIERIYSNIGQSLTVISGKAGTGKTLALTRIVHKHSLNHATIRFLTFNKLLVYDIKQTLRNFSNYNNMVLSIMTVHQFFFKQAQDLGITLLMGEARINELMEVTSKRIEQLRAPYRDLLQINNNEFDKEAFLKLLSETETEAADRQEFIQFSQFIRHQDVTDFDILKERYCLRNSNFLKLHIGKKLFIEDYYKVLERIYLAITDPAKFYRQFDVRNRYELLAVLYKMDVKKEEEYIIPLEKLEERVKMVARSVNWSRLFLIDECQDFSLLEKEILYSLRGEKYVVVASGGKEQLIRRNSLLDWTVSKGRKVPHLPFKLTDVSYRQKSNILRFVNAFGSAFGFSINLEGTGEELGLGKVIIDIRPKAGFIHPDIALDLKTNGELNGCSPYESVMFLVPSRNYTTKDRGENVLIDESDVVHRVEKTKNRKTARLNDLEQVGYFCWDGVTEDKHKLKIPHQTDTRILHYESCRGLEAWSCALMSFDDFFNFKRTTDEAATHLSDDLHFTEDERRDKFGALWCLMAITRPIENLYIQLDSSESSFSSKLLNIATALPGVEILR